MRFRLSNSGRLVLERLKIHLGHTLVGLLVATFAKRKPAPRRHESVNSLTKGSSLGL